MACSLVDGHRLLLSCTPEILSQIMTPQGLMARFPILQVPCGDLQRTPLYSVQLSMHTRRGEGLFVISPLMLCVTLSLSRGQGTVESPLLSVWPVVPCWNYQCIRHQGPESSLLGLGSMGSISWRSMFDSVTYSTGPRMSCNSAVRGLLLSACSGLGRSLM